MMNKRLGQVFFWAPRIICILFALFLGLFALDVFNEGYNAGETIIALLIHLVPVFLVVIALFIAWRWERVGSILFIVLAIYYLIESRGQGWIIFVPLLFIALLFLFSSLRNRNHE